MKLAPALLAMQEGYRESTASWEEVLRDLRERGLTEAPLLAVGDGGLGLWAALGRVYPETRHQRCWNHRAMNVIAKLPKRLQAGARAAVRGSYEAPTRAECGQRRAQYCTQLRAQGQEDAAACLERDWDDFVTVYDFPEEHWVHLRTSNPIESIFARVRLRTDAAKRMRVRENALYLVFKLVLRLALNWRQINGRNQLTLLLAGERFVDGCLQRSQPITKEGTAACPSDPPSWKQFPQGLTRARVVTPVDSPNVPTGRGPSSRSPPLAGVCGPAP